MNTRQRELHTTLMLSALVFMPDFPGAYIRGYDNPKSVFLDTAKLLLKELAKDLGLTEYKVNINPGGNGVIGEATLMGMWSENNGVSVVFSGFAFAGTERGYYRTIQNMQDHVGGFNHNFNLERFNYDWSGMVDEIGRLNKDLDSHQQSR